MNLRALGLLFSVALLASLTTVAVGQRSSDAQVDHLVRTEVLDADAQLEDTDVTINQVGNENEAEVIQRQFQSLDNTALISQRGDENRARLIQEGQQNEVILLQRGDDNVISLDLSGRGNDIAIVQLGDDNEVQQRLEDSYDLDVELTQRGDGNLIEYNADGLLSKHIIIRQEGSDMELIINRTSTRGN